MAAGKEAIKELLTFPRYLQRSYNTICEKLDLETIGPLLTAKDCKLSNSLKKKVHKAVVSKNNKVFYSILQNFDLESFEIFIEVLESIHDDNHEIILSHLCSNLDHLSLESEHSNPDTIAKLKGRAKKFKPPKSEREVKMEESLHSKYSPAHSFYLRPHPVETATFSKDIKENIFYSPIHGITVVVHQTAFPKDPDSFQLFLTVNDYSQRIGMPSEYTGLYSVLVSLRCEPEIEKFTHPVMVTLPHCYTGDKDSLCVLSAPERSVSESCCVESEVELVEDPDIEIESVDEHYITFMTMHFTRYRVAKTKQPKQRRKKRIQSLLSSPRKAASLDLPGATQTSEMPLPRSFSCPYPNDPSDTKFYAIMYAPHDKSTPVWKILFIVTYSLPSYIDHWKQIALEELQTGTSGLEHTMGCFNFSGSVIELHLDRHNVNGWVVEPAVSPAKIHKRDVERFFRMLHFLPSIKLNIHKEEETSLPAQFSITLSGSIPLLSFSFVCEPSPRQPRKKAGSIRIFSEMYQEECSIIKALSSGEDCSRILLSWDDVNCHTLFCEISFHLYKWIELTRFLEVDNLDIQALEYQYKNSPYYTEGAYKALEKWTISKQPCHLNTLIDGLYSIGINLEVTPWTLQNRGSETVKVVDEKLCAELAGKIKCHWKQVARLLGLSERDIQGVEIDYERENVQEKTCKMLLEWKKHSSLRDSDCYFRLHNSIRCVQEHCGDLNDAVWFLCM